MFRGFQMRIVFGRVFAPVVFLLSLAALPQLAAAQAVDFSGGYSQDFDTLASSGSTGSALPPGWAFAKNDAVATSYGVSDGTVESGNLYSFGAAGSSERSIGSIASNSTNSVRYGLALTNTTGSEQSSLALSFWVEQWRLGAINRDDPITFQYSLNATGIVDTAATWVTVSGLGFTGPVRTGATGALNGNAANNRAQVNGQITGMAWAAGQTLWLRWSDSNATGVDDALAIDDLLIGTLQDVPPVLVSTTPTSGANSVAVHQPVRLRFSESVDLAAGAAVFTCGGNAVAFGSNSPATELLLTPTQPLPYNTSCSLFIPASAITDRDGTPDPLGADISLSFTTEVDLPPQVLSTVPANGATGVAPAVTPSVQFTEIVTLAAPAFSLSCDTAGTIALSHPATGQNVTVTPLALLEEGDRCTLRVLANRIADSTGQPLPADVVVVFDVSAGPSGYYAQVNTSSPEQLRCSLHETIRGHTVFPYSGSGTNTWTILNLADEDPVDQSKILDAYKNESYTKITGGQGAYNREHTWPNSLGFASQNLAAYTDTHMLYLTHVGYNSDRGNKPYANCPGCTERPTTANHGLGGGSGVYPGNSNWFDGSSYEVWGHRKGDMARAIFYMAIRYEGHADDQANDGDIPDLELTDNRSLITSTSNTAARAYMGLLGTLLQWHQADPPDEAEQRRNEVVFSFQGNRNPFIDHPEWATRALFESSQPANCQLAQPPAQTRIFGDGFEMLN